MTREEFEQGFNSRTLAYHPDFQSDDRPIVIEFGDPADSAPGHLLLTSLTNQLARAHRRLVFVGDLDRPLQCSSQFGFDTLADATVGLATAVNPFIDATLERSAPSQPALLTIGVGTDAELTVGCDGWLALLGPSASVDSETTSLLGAALAACLCAAAAFHRQIGNDSLPQGIYSLWEFARKDGLNGPRFDGPIDVGQVLQVGAGAVGCALDMWAAFLGVAGSWDVVDGDCVEVSNLNRQLLFLARDAGFPDGRPQPKTSVIAARLGAPFRPHQCWYDDERAASLRTGRFDLVLALANERGVRPTLQSLGQTVLLHATTTPNWTAMTHRHISGHDDCIICRIPAEDDPSFSCSTAQVGNLTAHASLPFISASAGLLLLADIIRLQEGRLLERDENYGALDLRTPEPATRSFAWSCREACRAYLPPGSRHALNVGRRYAHLDGDLP